MPTPTNLYLSLQRSAVGHENFLTEAFAFLLDFVIHNDAQPGARLLCRITNNFFDAQATAPSDIQISTQASTQGGRPDIELRAPDRVLYIENKLEARLGYKQLERYHRTLNNTGCSATRLVLLSKYPLPSTEHEPDLVSIKWFQIGEWLEEALKAEEMGEVSSFLLRQFLDFLRERRLVFPRPRSSLSKSIQAYFTSAGEHNVIELGRAHSPKALCQIPQLVPLADLLGSVKDAIVAIRPKAKVSLWSGKSGWQGSAWIAYNVDKADLYVSLYVHESDVLAFESHRRRIYPALVKEGQGSLFTAYGYQMWRRTLDLAAPDLGFYAASQPDQQAILEEFLRDCFRMLDEISESS